MSYALSPDPSGKYIVVKVTGDLTRRVAVEFTVAAHALGAKLGIRCYLVDVVESRNVESVVGNYAFTHGDFSSSTVLDPEACIAVLVAPDDHSHDFVLTLAETESLDFTLFRDRDKAIAHLLAAASAKRE